MLILRYIALAIFAATAASGCARAPRQPAMTGPETVSLPGPDAFAWPLRGEVISGFGREDEGVRNKGIDIAAKDGCAVRASRDGRVAFCGETVRGFGKTIIIDHGNGYQSVYANNSRLLKGQGEAVKRGDAVAISGDTGRAKAPQLHFEIRRRGKPVNPTHYLRS